jgi:hypothetical protein
MPASCAVVFLLVGGARLELKFDGRVEGAGVILGDHLRLVFLLE